MFKSLLKGIQQQQANCNKLDNVAICYDENAANNNNKENNDIDKTAKVLNHSNSKQQQQQLGIDCEPKKASKMGRRLGLGRKSRKRWSSIVSRLNDKLTSGVKSNSSTITNKQPVIKSKPPTLTVTPPQQQQHQAEIVTKANTNTNQCNSYASDSDDDYKSAEESFPGDECHDYYSSEQSVYTRNDENNNNNEDISHHHDHLQGSPAANGDMSQQQPSGHQPGESPKSLGGGGGGECLLPEEDCDLPTFLYTRNCPRELIDETRRLLHQRYLKNADAFYQTDYKRMMSDDWTVTRFLLRRRQDPRRTAKLMEECGAFRKQYKMSEVQLWEFPREFHQAGGLFKYSTDRVGNVCMFMRVKMYRRIPEISDVFKAWILCVLEACDQENNGRGTAVVFDLSGCGLQNVDLGFLSWLLSSFRNYCPKGVSYIIVYNLPWFLNTTCKMAMSWMSATNRRALRFVHGAEIENFIAREHLPDYCGGTCKLNYKQVPEGSKPAIEVCEQLDITPEQALKIKEQFKQYLDEDEDENADENADKDRDDDHDDSGDKDKNDERDNNEKSDRPILEKQNADISGDITTTTTAVAIAKAKLDPLIEQTLMDGLAGGPVTIADEAAALHLEQRRPVVVSLVSQASKFIAH